MNGNTNIYGDIWRWKEIKPTNTDIEAVYGALYEVINRCNFMLDRADAVRKRPPTTRTSTSWTNVAERLTLPAHLPTRNW